MTGAAAEGDLTPEDIRGAISCMADRWLSGADADAAVIMSTAAAHGEKGRDLDRARLATARRNRADIYRRMLRQVEGRYRRLTWF